MICPICKRSLFQEEIENNVCVGCEHNMDEVREQQEIDAEEEAEFRHYETEPLSGRIYSI